MHPRSTGRRDGSDIADIIHGGGTCSRRNSPLIKPHTPSIKPEFHTSRPNTPASASLQRAYKSGAIPKRPKVSTPSLRRIHDFQPSSERRDGQCRRPAASTPIPSYKLHLTKKFYESPLKHFVSHEKLTPRRAQEWLAYLPTLRKYYRRRIKECQNIHRDLYEKEQRARKWQSELYVNEPNTYDFVRKHTSRHKKIHHNERTPSEESFITPESAKIPSQKPRKPVRHKVKRVCQDTSTPKRKHLDIEASSSRKHAQAHLFHTIRKKWGKPNLGDYKINFPDDDDVESLGVDEETENEMKDQSDKWFPKTSSPLPSWTQKRWLEKIRTTQLPHLTWNCTRRYNHDYPRWANRGQVLETVRENSSQIDEGDDLYPQCETGSDDGRSSYDPN